MADVNSFFNPSEKGFKFIGLPNINEFNSYVPRQEIIFGTESGSVTLSGVGDTQSLFFRNVLPAGFAYAMSELSCMIQDTVAGQLDDWKAPTCYITDSDADPGYKVGLTMRVDTTVLSSGLTKQVWQVESPLKQLIIPRGQATDAFVQVGSFNASTNKAALTFWGYARFFQYNLNQAHYWAVNSPVPVRG